MISGQLDDCHGENFALLLSLQRELAHSYVIRS